MDSITSAAVLLLGISWKDRMDQASGSTVQRTGNKSRSSGAHEGPWIRTARPGAAASPKDFSTHTAGTCGISGRAAPRSGSLRSRESRKNPDEAFQKHRGRCVVVRGFSVCLWGGFFVCALFNSSPELSKVTDAFLSSQAH